jgi:hypothetical protein
MVHKGLVAYQVNRDSTAISALKKVTRKHEEKGAKPVKKLGKNMPTPQRADGDRKVRRAGRENIN